MTKHENSVLIVAHTSAQADHLSALLRGREIEGETYSSVGAATVAAGRGAGALLVDRECLSAAAVQVLQDFKEAEPSWSDLPVIILGVDSSEADASAPVENAIVLERPVCDASLLAAVRHALCNRLRQYAFRDLCNQQQRYQDSLRQSEKLAVMGRLAASIAHEINNPLEAITNLLYLVQNSNSLADAKRYTQMAQSELSRVGEITVHTLRFYRQQNKPDRTDVCDLLRSVLTLHLPRLTASRICVEEQYEGNHKVMGHAGELRQLFANLIGNAVDAMPNGGRLVLRLRACRERRGDQRHGVRVLVSDSGPGIPHHVRRTIFEPFVTTKGSSGTGLGLWVSHGIVQRHGGTLKFRSCTGPASSGTTFAVFFPSEQGTMAQSAAS